MRWNGGARLKEARQRAGLTIEELADKTNVSKRTVINYENNSSEPPVSFLVTVAKICSVGFTWLALGQIINSGMVNEPQETYGLKDLDLGLLKELLELPDARLLIYKYIFENIKTSELAAQLDQYIIKSKE